MITVVRLTVSSVGHLNSQQSWPGLSSDILHCREQTEADISLHRTKAQAGGSHISHHLNSKFNDNDNDNGNDNDSHLNICLVSRNRYKGGLKADTCSHRSSENQGW